MNGCRLQEITTLIQTTSILRFKGVEQRVPLLFLNLIVGEFEKIPYCSIKISNRKVLYDSLYNNKLQTD
jgi:hypothetical protein